MSEALDFIRLSPNNIVKMFELGPGLLAEISGPRIVPLYWREFISRDYGFCATLDFRDDPWFSQLPLKKQFRNIRSSSYGELPQLRVWLKFRDLSFAEDNLSFRYDRRRKFCPFQVL